MGRQFHTLTPALLSSHLLLRLVRPKHEPSRFFPVETTSNFNRPPKNANRFGRRNEMMKNTRSCLLGFSIFFLFAESVGALEGGGGRRRGLLGFKEHPKGSNLTYNCSPSGPCVPRQYSEKKEAKYRCSETGYRIPFKCAPMKDVAKDGHGKKSQKSRSAVEITRDDAARNGRADENGREQRSLLDESSKENSQAYVTYRSCIPPPEEEKLSMLGFEGIVFGLLLISGSFVFLRKNTECYLARSWSRTDTDEFQVLISCYLLSFADALLQHQFWMQMLETHLVRSRIHYRSTI